MRGAKYALGLAAAGAAAAVALVGRASGEALSNQSRANRISINGGRGVDATTIRRELEATAIAHPGQTVEGLAGGVDAYQAARGGDKGQALKEARGFADVIATFSSATGKGADEIGHAAALISKNQGPKTVQEMGQALAQLVAHAKESGQPLSEAIGHLDKMGATAKRLGLTGANGTAQMGRASETRRRGRWCGQGDKVAEAFLRKITSDKTARTLKAAGADPYADKNGTLKDPREMIRGLYSKIGRADSASDKLSTINKTVGPQGAKMLDPLNKAFGAAYGAANGSDKDKGPGRRRRGSLLRSTRPQRRLETTLLSRPTQRRRSKILRPSSQPLGRRLFRPSVTASHRSSSSWRPSWAKASRSTCSSPRSVHAADALDALAHKLGFDGTPTERADIAKNKAAVYQKQLDAMGPYDNLSTEDQAKYRGINAKKLKASQAADDALEEQRKADFEKSQEELQRASGGIVQHGRGTPEMQENQRKFDAGEGEWAHRTMPEPVAMGRNGMPAYATDPAATHQPRSSRCRASRRLLEALHGGGQTLCGSGQDRRQHLWEEERGRRFVACSGR